MAALEKCCPRCNTSTYHNPDLKLLVNICGHKLCEACVDSVFTRPTAACPECGLPLRRTQYRVQQFEDASVEKEVDIRKRIVKDFNKCEEDFPTLEEYNDYLEEVENIVFNLTNGVDVEETKEKVEQYRTDNRGLILKNRQKQIREEKALASQVNVDQFREKERAIRAREEEKESMKKKKEAKEQLLNELGKSNRSAKDLVSEYSAKQNSSDHSGSLKEMETGPVYGLDQIGTAVFEPIPELDMGELYSYESVPMDLRGPDVFDVEAAICPVLETSRLGGGFSSAQACRRLLEEAYSCLFLEPSTSI